MSLEPFSSYYTFPVGGVAIIDGFAPWAILAELLTHEGFGTLFQARLG